MYTAALTVIVMDTARQNEDVININVKSDTFEWQKTVALTDWWMQQCCVSHVWIGLTIHDTNFCSPTSIMQPAASTSPH